MGRVEVSGALREDEAACNTVPSPVASGRLLAVVDSVQAIHTRRTGKSSLYTKIGGKKQV